MSILIKGMEMPEYEKIMVVYPDGCTKLYKRSDMVKVPTPHGRLIDADALLELYEIPETNDKKVPEWEHLLVPINIVKQNIKDAPTVIEAEGE